jgi:hypothetical protein
MSHKDISPSNEGEGKMEISLKNRNDGPSAGKITFDPSRTGPRIATCLGSQEHSFFVCLTCDWKHASATLYNSHKRKRSEKSPRSDTSPSILDLKQHLASEEHKNQEESQSPTQSNPLVPPQPQLLALGTFPRNNSAINPTTEDVEKDTISQGDTEQLLQSIVGNDKMKSFLEMEGNERHSATRKLITTAHDTTTRVVSKSDRTCNNEGAYIMATYARLFVGMSEKDRDDFAWVSKTLLDLQTPQAQQVFDQISLPKNVSVAKAICITNVHSIQRSLPIPKVMIISSDHVVIDPNDSLRWFFSTASVEVISRLRSIHIDMDPPQVPAGSVMESYHDSKAYIGIVADCLDELKADDSFKSFLLADASIWSDAFDPASNKDNRNSVWCMLLYFRASRGSGMSAIPLAIGNKSGDHSVAIRDVLGRIRAMGTYFSVHNVNTKKNHRIKTEVGHINVDRLEKGELWGGLHHQTNRCKSFPIIAGFKGDKDCEVKYKQGCCPDCVKDLTQLYLNPSLTGVILPCPDCAQHDHMPGNNTILNSAAPPALRAPTYEHLEEGSLRVYLERCTTKIRVIVEGDTDFGSWDAVGLKLITNNPSRPPIGRRLLEGDDIATEFGPVWATAQFMASAAAFVTFQVWQGAMNKKAAAAWGTVFGWSEAITQKIFQHAEKRRAEGAKSFLEVFDPNVLPPTWTDPTLSMDKFMSSPMHLIYLGLTKTVCCLVEECLSLWGLQASYRQNSSLICDKVGKLGLQYVRAIKFGSSVLSRGSWVSENYVAYSKLFLVAHAGLLLQKKVDKEEAKYVLRTVESFYCLVSLLMQRRIDSKVIKRTNICLKVFLSAVQGLEESIERIKDRLAAEKLEREEEKKKKKKKKNPTATVESTAAAAKAKPVKVKKPISISYNVANFASLPNATACMASHGPLPEFWEGGPGGEKEIQPIKPFFLGIPTNNATQLQKATERYLRDKQLTALQTSLRTDIREDVLAGKPRARYNSAKRYPNKGVVLEALDQLKEISGTLRRLPTGGDIITVDVAGEDYEIAIKSVTAFEVDVLYFGALMFQTLQVVVQEDDIVTFVTLVPGKMLWRDKLETLPVDALYTVVGDNYSVLKEDGSVGPKLPSKSLW